MSEQSPEKPPEAPKPAVENKEKAERQPRYRTVGDIEALETHPDGAKTERTLECNGLRHRVAVEKVWRDEDDKAYYAEFISQDEIGPCDCKHS
ncbi:MAG: hypothetical protein WCT37_00270 [Patescibacteria group bacterium]|jgi:hypothetical protein